MKTNATNNKNSDDGPGVDGVLPDSESSINEQISSIINKKFNESLDQIQEDPDQLVKKSFYSRFWRSTKSIITEQLESIGRGFYAAMIAIIVAIITPLIINSNMLTKLEVMSQKIEGALPTEQDKEIQNKIIEAINAQTLLSNNVSEVASPQATVHSELEKHFSENLLLVQSNVDERFKGLETSIALLQDEISNLKEQKQQLNKKIKELNLTGFNGSIFLQRLDNLKRVGKQLQDQVAKNVYRKTELESWLKTVYFLAGSIPLVKQSSFDGGPLLAESMRDVLESKGHFREAQRQISETFVILDSIELLAVSGLIENHRYAAGG